jgi:hypothetical protein
MILFSKWAAKLLHQTDKTCHKLKKNAKKIVFLGDFSGVECKV